MRRFLLAIVSHFVVRQTETGWHLKSSHFASLRTPGSPLTTFVFVQVSSLEFSQQSGLDRIEMRVANFIPIFIHAKSQLGAENVERAAKIRCQARSERYAREASLVLVESVNSPTLKKTN